MNRDNSLSNPKDPAKLSNLIVDILSGLKAGDF